MNLGQVYTKKCIADFMVGLLDLPSGSRILDPCFGKGVFIKSLLSKADYNIDGIEIDEKSFQSYRNINDIHINLMCKDFFDHIAGGYDGIIMNPPYVRHEEIDLMSHLGVCKKKLQACCKDTKITLKSNLYVYFIVHAISLLKTGGRLIVIFPNAWKNSTLGKSLNEAFASNGYIANYISVKGNPFEDSPLVDVCILKFIKGENGTTIYTDLKINNDNLTWIDKNELQPISFVSDNTIELKNICTIKRGLTTFCNKIFINPPISNHEYLRPIISSPKSLKGWSTENAIIDSVLILPRNTVLPDYIKDYLTLSKNKIINDKKSKTLSARIKSSEFWYSLNPQEAGDIIFPYIIRKQPCFILNTENLMARDNFYTFISSINHSLLIALLNNRYIYSQLELIGKTYGNGLLKIQKYDVDSLKVINPQLLSQESKERLYAYGRILTHKNDYTAIDLIDDELLKYYNIDCISDIYTTLKTNRLTHE